MKVAVLYEFSGAVRDAFLSRGHDAVSCDLLPTESPGRWKNRSRTYPGLARAMAEQWGGVVSDGE